MTSDDDSEDDSPKRRPFTDLAVRLIFGSRGDALVTFRKEMFDRSERRVGEMWIAAVDDSGTDAESLLASIQTDERLSDLFASVVETAARTRWHAKLQALGKVLAMGVTADDDTTVDATEALDRAIRGLEPVHVRVLALIRQIGRFNPQGTGLASWIAKAFPNADLVAAETAAYLQSRGLVLDPFYVNGVLELTPLGERVMSLIDAATSPAIP